MNGKENIINKILSDADGKCVKLLETARLQAKSIVESVEQAVQKDRQQLDERIATISAERKRNRTLSAQLEARKYKLNAKQQLVSMCYAQAYQQIAKFSPSERTAFVGSLLEQYAEVGETVYVTEADGKVVSQAFLDGFDKKLKLANTYIQADGGIVLEGVGYEKDLTLSRVVALLREKTEARVVKELLGDSNE